MEEVQKIYILTYIDYEMEVKYPKVPDCCIGCFKSYEAAKQKLEHYVLTDIRGFYFDIIREESFEDEILHKYCIKLINSKDNKNYRMYTIKEALFEE